MGLPEEMYCAMLDAGYAMKRLKVPGAKDIINSARKCLPLWRDSTQNMVLFCRGVLKGPRDLRVYIGQLPEPVASTCSRLVSLMELATLDVLRTDE